MSTQTVSVLFFGTPSAAVASLEALLGNPGVSVIGVVTQPDRPSGRGQQITPSPVKVAAASHGITILQPDSLKGIVREPNGELNGSSANRDFVDFLNSQPPIDLFVVVAFGQIIPRSLLDHPPHGIVNVHYSLLPRWRGAAPIQRAIAAGDKTTGVSIMRIEAGLDTGPVYAVKEIKVHSDDNFGTIHDKLSSIGAELLVESVPKIVSGELKPAPQSESGATHAAKWERADMQIQWSDPAQTTIDRIRASSPIWGARTTLSGELIKIYAAVPAPVAAGSQYPAGTIVATNKAEIVVRAGDNSGVAITELQFAGKRKMPAKEYLAGHPVPIGTRFDESTIELKTKSSLREGRTKCTRWED